MKITTYVRYRGCKSNYLVLNNQPTSFPPLRRLTTMSKRNTDHTSKKPKFLKKPSFPGGNKAFQQFVKDNLVYPPDALSAKIEGTVYLGYTVDNHGNTGDLRIIHSLCESCDEEAIRLVRLIRYPAVKNRGVRMKVTMQTSIQFKLAQEKKVEPVKQEINLHYSASNAEKPKQPTPPSRQVFSYQINIGKNPETAND